MVYKVYIWVLFGKKIWKEKEALTHMQSILTSFSIWKSNMLINHMFQECKFCRECMTVDHSFRLRIAYLEHMNRKAWRRVIPMPILVRTDVYSKTCPIRTPILRRKAGMISQVAYCEKFTISLKRLNLCGLSLWWPDKAELTYQLTYGKI